MILGNEQTPISGQPDNGRAAVVRLVPARHVKNALYDSHTAGGLHLHNIDEQVRDVDIRRMTHRLHAATASGCER